MINKEKLEERLVVLDEDIAKVQNNLKVLEQQRVEAVGILNALTGAKQQCDSFLNEFHNEKEPSGSESDVDK